MSLRWSNSPRVDSFWISWRKITGEALPTWIGIKVAVSLYHQCCARILPCKVVEDSRILPHNAGWGQQNPPAQCWLRTKTLHVEECLLSLEPLYADIKHTNSEYFRFWAPQSWTQICSSNHVLEKLLQVWQTWWWERRWGSVRKRGSTALQSERGWKEWVWENKQWGLLDEGFFWDVTVHSKTGL